MYCLRAKLISNFPGRECIFPRTFKDHHLRRIWGANSSQIVNVRKTWGWSYGEMSPQKGAPCFCNIASGNDARFTNHVQPCIEAKLREYWLWLDIYRFFFAEGRTTLYFLQQLSLSILKLLPAQLKLAFPGRSVNAFRYPEIRPARLLTNNL